MFLHLLFIMLLLFVVFGNVRPVGIIYLKKLAVPILCILFILCLIVFSSNAVTSAAKGINLWMGIVFPSLFPFFVASEVLNKTGFVRAAGILLEPVMRPLFNVPGCGSFAFLMGITSGYPVGAKITTRMREERLLTKTEAERLLTFTNNSGPLFITGAVSVGMFNMSGLGMLLLVSHISACITVGLMFKFYHRNERQIENTSGGLLSRLKKELLFGSNDSLRNLGSILGDAVKNSVITMMIIGGFIIIFSVLINILIDTGLIYYISNAAYVLLSPLGISKDIISALISGFFEITTGTNMSSKSFDASLTQQLVAASMIIGWAGLSVHSQVLSIVTNTDISIKPYLAGKFLQGIFSAVYTFIAIKIVGISFLDSQPTFSQIYTQSQLKWQDYFFSSCKALCIILSFFTVLFAISILLKCVRKKSRA